MTPAQLAEEITDAIVAAKASMAARAEPMKVRHVRDAVAGVLAKRWPVEAPQLDVKATAAAQAIYAAYPRHEAPKTAQKAILAAMKAIPADALLAKVQAYRAATDRWPAAERKQFIPLPATWFNRGSYHDDPQVWERGKPAPVMQDTTNGYTKF